MEKEGPKQQQKRRATPSPPSPNTTPNYSHSPFFFLFPSFLQITFMSLSFIQSTSISSGNEILSQLDRDVWAVAALNAALIDGDDNGLGCLVYDATGIATLIGRVCASIWGGKSVADERPYYHRCDCRIIDWNCVCVEERKEEKWSLIWPSNVQCLLSSFPARQSFLENKKNIRRHIQIINFWSTNI